MTGVLRRPLGIPKWSVISSRLFLLKVNNRNPRIMCEICLKLTLKTPERRQWRRSCVFVCFEHISHLALGFLLLTVNMSLPSGYFAKN